MINQSEFSVSRYINNLYFARNYIFHANARTLIPNYADTSITCFFAVPIKMQISQSTSGIAGPKCGGEQLASGRISLLSGAMEISKLYRLFSILAQAAGSRLFMLSQRSKSTTKETVQNRCQAEGRIHRYIITTNL